MRRPEWIYTFWLAEKLGYTVEELGRKMSSCEYEMWKAYHGRDPAKVDQTPEQDYAAFDQLKAFIESR